MNKTNYNESKSFDGKSSHALKYKVMYFESLYFSDMTMEDYEERLTLEEDDKGNKYTSYFSHTLEDWVVIHARMRKYGGDCFGKRKTIRIKRGLDENTENENLLHEMIHAYISLLPEFHHSYLLLQFYDYLKKRIGQKKLNEYINYEAHKQVYDPNHDLLFMFKSLKLDLKLKKNLGTIYSYGRQKIFKKVK